MHCLALMDSQPDPERPPDASEVTCPEPWHMGSPRVLTYLTFLLGSAPQSTKPEPPQEEGMVPALLDLSCDTKHPSKRDRPRCALRPVEEAAALSGIPRREAGDLPGHPSCSLTGSAPREGHILKKSEFVRVKHRRLHSREKAADPTTCLQARIALATAPPCPALRTASASGDPSVSWDPRGAREGSPLNNGPMSL